MLWREERDCEDWRARRPIQQFLLQIRFSQNQQQKATNDLKRMTACVGDEIGYGTACLSSMKRVVVE